MGPENSKFGPVYFQNTLDRDLLGGGRVFLGAENVNQISVSLGLTISKFIQDEGLKSVIKMMLILEIRSWIKTTKMPCKNVLFDGKRIGIG